MVEMYTPPFFFLTFLLLLVEQLYHADMHIMLCGQNRSAKYGIVLYYKEKISKQNKLIP
jgi:hypothetical protein